MDEFKFKVIMLGESGVGKTSLLVRYKHDAFDEERTSTFQQSFVEKKFTVNSNSVSLGLWDTAGQEKANAIAPMYFRGADAAVIVFDVTDRKSFQKLKYWIEQLRKHSKDTKIFIAANKCDVESDRQV